jgi:hypothetical protein
MGDCVTYNVKEFDIIQNLMLTQMNAADCILLSKEYAYLKIIPGFMIHSNLMPRMEGNVAGLKNAHEFYQQPIKPAGIGKTEEEVVRGEDPYKEGLLPEEASRQKANE